MTITLPWWGFLLYGIFLVELGRFSHWTGDMTGRAIVRWMRHRREKRES